MKRLDPTMRRAAALWRSEAGATSIEYALIAASISIVISAAAFQIGESLDESFDNLLSLMQGEDGSG